MIREAELRTLVPYLPMGARILEIGGGSGWQAAALARLGFSVESVDLESNPYRETLEWPIGIYDGVRLPFPDHSFDLVFSSNVLEHVENLDALLRDMARVVKPRGIGLHLMPTPQWRLLTFVTHYPWLVGVIVRLLTGKPVGLGRSTASQPRSKWRLLRSALAAPRHGEHGSAVGELWSFRRAAWVKRLSRLGWRLEADWGVGILYSGYFVLHPWLGLHGRRKAASLFGSSCRGYLLRREANIQ